VESRRRRAFVLCSLNWMAENMQKCTSFL
jgi:hypothetical protein